MQSLILALSARTISSIVITCLILALILAFVIIWLLWKKNKIGGKMDGFMYKTTNYFSGMGRQVKSKLITNYSKGEKALYWTVLSAGLLSSILELCFEISMGYYTMTFVRSVFFLCMITLMIAFNARYAPVSPYYYEYNPTLFFYSAISLFFAVLDFFMGFGSARAIGIGVPMFVGNLMFFGTIFFTRYSKTVFQARDILVYVGALIIAIMNIISFGTSVFSIPLYVVVNVIGLIYNVGMVVLLTFFYDGFAFAKRLFKK